MAQEKPKLSDQEVASVAVVANLIGIRAGELAKKKSKTPEIIQFAQTMIYDHQAVIGQALALVKKLDVTPRDNVVSKGLLAGAEKTQQALQAKTGKAFDEASIDNEVAYHQAVIGAIEGMLIPESENAELKALLEQVIPAFKTHLAHAEMVQKRFAQ